MSRLLVSGVVVVALAAVTTPTPASSVTYDKLAYLTFSAPVQIPGATLGAGTYRFHLADPHSSRNVLQVLSNDGSIVYGMFFTITDSRTSVTEEPVVTFRETPAGVPPAIRSLFYGGEHRGYQFVYPKGGPVMVRQAPPQGEIAYTPLPAAPVVEPEVEPVVEPEIEIAEPEPIPEPVLEQAPPEPAPVELPRTASPLPLMAAGGLISLVAGLGLGLLRRRAG
jgi:outer membrane biosynthesis protein TonB